MCADFRIIRIDLQGSSQFDNRVLELPLARQRQSQLVVRNRVVWPQQHRLPRVRLGLLESAVFEQRAREVPPRGGVLRNSSTMRRNCTMASPRRPSATKASAASGC